jgi:predicted small secreted protein
MKESVLILLALGAILAITACNTVHGAGQDVKSAGQGIENASDRH